jgi:hypothetical protein
MQPLLRGIHHGLRILIHRIRLVNLLRPPGIQVNPLVRRGLQHMVLHTKLASRLHVQLQLRGQQCGQLVTQLQLRGQLRGQLLMQHHIRQAKVQPLHIIRVNLLQQHGQLRGQLLMQRHIRQAKVPRLHITQVI